MDFNIPVLGEPKVASPIKLSNVNGDFIADYVRDEERLLFRSSLADFQQYCRADTLPPSFEIAGPRERIYFDPSKTGCAIVTCGGLCPGINDVIRAMVLELWHGYGVRRIAGIRYGFSGFLPEAGHAVLDLNPHEVSTVHLTGGTVLGSSRGNVPAESIVDALERMNISALFVIGGDGTQKGAFAIYEAVTARKLKIAVVGIPKTIDNDIPYVEQTFGYETAFSIAGSVVRNAHVEAVGAYNGIGLVKLMGRDSGFIAASAAIATHDVNFVLVPEVPFDLDGDNGFLFHLRQRLEKRHHAVICVAEGAGQNMIAVDRNTLARDASGNVKHADIGAFLCERIKQDLSAAKIPYSLKYIDPSYIIRSAPAIASDAVYCSMLGADAVHAAMSGKTGLLVGRWGGVHTHVPISAVIRERKKIDPESYFWLKAVGSTGQPLNMRK